MSHLINLPKKSINCDRGRYGHETGIDVGSIQTTENEVRLYPRRGKNPVVISGERNFLIEVLSQTVDALRRND